MRSLRAQLERNIFSSWTLYAVRLAVALFFVPYVTSALGDQRYGVWVIALQTVTYLSLLDFGLERALVRLISRALGLDDFPQVNRLLNTSSLLYALLGALVLLAAWAVTTFGFQYFKIADPLLREEGRQALLLLGAYMALRLWLFPFANSLGAFQRYDVSNVLQLCEELVRTALMVLALSRGSGLAALAAIILGASAARSVVSIIWLRHTFPQVTFSPGLADRAAARELWDYGRTALGITALWMVIFNSDAILLGLFSSAAAAGIFSPAMQVINQARNLINAVANPLTATISQLESQGDLAAVRGVYTRGLSYLTYLAVVLMVGVIAFAGPFVHLWLPDAFAESAPVLAVLALGSAVFIPQIIGNSILFGIGKHNILLRVLAVEAVMKVALATLLIGKMGPMGMALATVIPQFILYTIVFPYLLSKTVDIPFRFILTISIRTTFWAVVLAGGAAVLVRSLISLTTWPLLIGGMVVVAAAGSVGGWYVLSAADHRRVRQWFERLTKSARD